MERLVVVVVILLLVVALLVVGALANRCIILVDRTGVGRGRGRAAAAAITAGVGGVGGGGRGTMLFVDVAFAAFCLHPKWEFKKYSRVVYTPFLFFSFLIPVLVDDSNIK